MTWNNNNLRPGNPLQRPTTMTIERIIIRLVDTPPEMYHRPLAVTNFDGRQQDFIADRVVQAMHGSRSAGTLTRSSFAGCAGGCRLSAVTNQFQPPDNPVIIPYLAGSRAIRLTSNGNVKFKV